MSELDLIENDIEGFLARHEEKELLRFVTIGSVDDGKSTLIGRLLYDTGNVFDDHLAAVTTQDADGTERIDLANLTDGLQAEREQGITIDVAFRYFSTENRKFIISDTPGHVQYTRNMATGASNAHVAIILIDARLGVLQQTRRHATIADLLGIRHLLVAVNKMDLVDFDQATYEAIRSDMHKACANMAFTSVTCIPVSALDGDQVARPGTRMPWYEGETILDFLQTVPVPGAATDEEFYLPVQYVLRPDLNFRGYAGTIASGVIRPGDVVRILPSGKTTTVERIVSMGADLPVAHAPQSVVLTLRDEIDISRGDALVHAEHHIHVARKIEANVVWMSDEPMEFGKQYEIKHTTRSVAGAIDHVHHRLNMDNLEDEVCETLELNDVGKVTISLNRPLNCTAYVKNRDAGAFIIIDRLSNVTVGAGMITGFGPDLTVADLAGLKRRIDPDKRAARFGQVPSVIWIGGRHGIGKMLIAHLLERRLFEAGHLPFCLDIYNMKGITIPAFGEDFQHILEHIDICLDMGYISIIACTTPRIADRRRARAHAEHRVPSWAYLETHLEASVTACRARILDDGRDVTLCDIDYEAPSTVNGPDLIVDAENLSHEQIEQAVDDLISMMQQRGIIR